MVLSFQILLPLLIGTINATKAALSEPTAASAGFTSEMQFLFSYAVVMITAGVLLFGFVWEE